MSCTNNGAIGSSNGAIGLGIGSSFGKPQVIVIGERPLIACLLGKCLACCTALLVAQWFLHWGSPFYSL